MSLTTCHSLKSGFQIFVPLGEGARWQRPGRACSPIPTAPLRISALMLPSHAAHRLTDRHRPPSLNSNMKPQGPAKHLIVAFLLALVGYIFIYQTIEHQRTRKGPWQVSFTQGTASAPTLIITQPRLGITNVQISFPGETLPVTNSQPTTTTLFFALPRPVPYDVPFGKCVFMDATFLPGTITFELFGHEIELLPRALIIDRKEHR